jgi:hypothetical protein
MAGVLLVPWRPGSQLDLRRADEQSRAQPASERGCGDDRTTPALAIVVGALAVTRVEASGGWRTGKGMATAGIVLG